MRSPHSTAYEYFAFTLLAVGLYSGTYAIEPGTPFATAGSSSPR